MKTTTTALVPLPPVPPAPGPIGPGDRLRRPGLRPLGSLLRPRVQAQARTSPDPGPQRLLPAAALPRRAGQGPAGPIPRPFPPETRP
jgi:hypothetical protein